MVRSRTSIAALALAGALTTALVSAPAASAGDPAPLPSPQEMQGQLTTRAPAPVLRDLTAGERLPSVQEALDELVAAGVVGTVAAVEKGNRHQEWSSGKKRVWNPAPVGPQAPFRVASNTKSMVATLVMQMVERGHWKLTDTVDRLAPGLLSHHGSITLEQLLSHTSGMPDGLSQTLLAHVNPPFTWDTFFSALGDDYSDAEIIRTALAQPWLSAPGAKYNYSNAGYVVLGQLLQRHTGKRLPALMRERIFIPAGMTSATFATKPGMPRNALHDAAFTKWRWYSLADFNPELFSAAGAVVASARDVVKFADALNNGVLVRKSTLANMRTPRAGGDYGLGIYRLSDPCKPSSFIYGHDGLSFGTASYAFSSADGTRQVVLALTGRAFAPPLPVMPYDAGTPLLALFAQTC